MCSKSVVLRSFIRSALVLGLCAFAIIVSAHPEDEFCEGAVLDPLLCAQLAELDRAEPVNLQSNLPEIQLERSVLNTFLLYARLGIEHILPMGLDHLAFVLALVLAAKNFRALLVLISVFTLAHSVTLFLGVLKLIELNSRFVEIIIALSIAFVAIENLLFKFRMLWRSFIVFGFGLLHGLGFAGALSDLGVPNAHFFGALIGFNVGVEIAQVFFGLSCFLVLVKFVPARYFKSYVFLPGNVVIAVIGLFWFFERLF